MDKLKVGIMGCGKTQLQGDGDFSRFPLIVGISGRFY